MVFKFLRGANCVPLGKYEEALNDYIECAEADAIATDKMMDAFAELAKFYYEPTDARLKFLCESHDNPDYLYYRANINKEIGRYEIALPIFRDLNENLGFNSFYDALAQCYTALGDYEKALEYAELEIEEYPSDEAQMLKVFALTNLNRYAELIEQATAQITNNPENSAWYFVRGISYMQLGNYQAAVDDLSTELVLNPGDLFSHYNRGKAYSKLGDNAMATADFRRCVADTKDPDPYMLTAYAYAKLNECDKALETLQKQIGENELDENQIYEVACVYGLLGDTTQAIDYLRKALEQGYTDIGILEYDEDLVEVRKLPEYHEFIERHQAMLAEKLADADRQFEIYTAARGEHKSE